MPTKLVSLKRRRNTFI